MEGHDSMGPSSHVAPNLEHLCFQRLGLSNFLLYIAQAQVFCYDTGKWTEMVLKMFSTLCSLLLLLRFLCPPSPGSPLLHEAFLYFFYPYLLFWSSWVKTNTTLISSHLSSCSFRVATGLADMSEALASRPLVKKLRTCRSTKLVPLHDVFCSDWE